MKRARRVSALGPEGASRALHLAVAASVVVAAREVRGCLAWPGVAHIVSNLTHNLACSARNQPIRLPPFTLMRTLVFSMLGCFNAARMSQWLLFEIGFENRAVSADAAHLHLTAQRCYTLYKVCLRALVSPV